ncbi:MAG: phenylalanine--tRNA ligase subunit beta, partial [Steroidobacteraceae bacterium]
MKLPLSALRAWVDFPWDARELAQRLTMAGMEIEGLEPAAPPFSGVVVAKILKAERHPRAEKLQVCTVATSGAADAPTVQIVCGASNARAGLVSALATEGARLPGDVQIKAAQLRGVESFGMLCSARELGLGDSAEGILELPADLPLGTDLRGALDLDDVVLEVNVTANRGDGLSVLGIAREVSALSGAPLQTPAFGRNAAGAVAAGCAPSNAAIAPLPLGLPARGGAGRLVAGVMRAVDNTTPSPLWLKERLRRSGLRSISPVVDVTNYVMLELGQPLHAYDRAALSGTLVARWARAGEQLRLLDGRDIALEPDVLVIADDASILGLAGIMGGERSAISAATREIALEVAWFLPAAIAGRARRYGLMTDASQRFERGVDYRIQERALEVAMTLIAELTGAELGPVSVLDQPESLPSSSAVQLRETRVTLLLGQPVAPVAVEQRLRALGMRVAAESHAGAATIWRVEPPSWRFDIALEADLIEEVARIGGFDCLAERDAPLPAAPRPLSSAQVDERLVLRTLAARGYQEAITYAFVDPALQRALLGEVPMIELSNPIASDMAVMRRSLWPGLLRVARENLRRQQSRVRLFEIANRFLTDASGNGHGEHKALAVLALGSRLPEQWGAPTTAADFYDVKADLEALLALGGAGGEFSFEPAEVAGLRPGRSAAIVRGGVEIGCIGELHPAVMRKLDFTYAPILF